MELHLPYKLLFLACAASLLAGYLLPTFGQFIVPPYSGVGAIVLIVGGLALGLWAKRTIVAHDSTLNPYGQPTHLVTSGPFRFSRNPMYLSYVVIVLGCAVYTGVLAAFVAPTLYFLYLQYKVVLQEEQKLSDIFPTEYSAYSRTVRRWL